MTDTLTDTKERAEAWLKSVDEADWFDPSEVQEMAETVLALANRLERAEQQLAVETGWRIAAEAALGEATGERDGWRRKFGRASFERNEAEEKAERLEAALREAVEWLESRPDYTEGDAATAAQARAALSAAPVAAKEET